ncbi:MAG TPA: CsbD family protein [Puia sp.]
MMHLQSLKGSWEQIKGDLKKKFGKLTDDDLRYVEGEEEVLLGRLERKLGVKREELEKIIKEHMEKPKVK